MAEATTEAAAEGENMNKIAKTFRNGSACCVFWLRLTSTRSSSRSNAPSGISMHAHSPLYLPLATPTILTVTVAASANEFCCQRVLLAGPCTNWAAAAAATFFFSSFSLSLPPSVSFAPHFLHELHEKFCLQFMGMCVSASVFVW